MAQDFLSEFIERVQARDSRLGRVLKSPTAGVLKRCVDGFQRSNDLLWASALTYTTGLSIVPILAVALSALNGLGGAKVIRPLLEHYLTANSPEITDRLMSFVSNVNAKTLGAVGAATLLFTVVLTLGTVEQALNNIFRVVHGRTMARKFADYLSVTFAVPVLLAGALGVRQILIDHLPNISGAGWISSSLAIWAGFFFLYVFFPNRRVRFEAAAVGSLVASILLQFAQWAFIYFQYGVNQYAVIYGALASIPVLLTWIYMTWVIVLLGAELTAAFERRNEPLGVDPWAMSERAVALAVTLRLGERMAGQRGTVIPATLAAELSIDEALLVEVLRRLERGGIVIETNGGNGGEHGLFLARDASTIGLREVLECVRGSGPAVVSSDARVAAMVERLRESERETLGGLTVRDLIDRSANAAAPVSVRAPERAADRV
ncbi:MAG: YhjD/YihY/BrkB family envelope integrity protein [Candidatus Binataceae bacterium]